MRETITNCLLWNTEEVRSSVLGRALIFTNRPSRPAVGMQRDHKRSSTRISNIGLHDPSGRRIGFRSPIVGSRSAINYGQSLRRVVFRYYLLIAARAR